MRHITKEEKAAWVKALRSGRYPQTCGLLHRKTDHPGVPDKKAGYCCLGVLAKVTRVQSTSEYDLQRTDEKGYTEALLLPGKVQDALADLNDDGVPFEVLAGLIDCALEAV